MDFTVSATVKTGVGYQHLYRKEATLSSRSLSTIKDYLQNGVGRISVFLTVSVILSTFTMVYPKV